MYTPKSLVSRKQAFLLKKLGFDTPVSYYLINAFEVKPFSNRRFNCLFTSSPVDWNNVLTTTHQFEEEIKESLFISVPTVYEALEWISNQGINVGYVYIEKDVKYRYKELRNVLDANLKLLISSRKMSAKSKKPSKSLSK